MAFLTIPVFFIDEEDAKEKSKLGLDYEPDDGFIRVNTNNICTYHETGEEDQDTKLHMTDGTEIIVPLEIEDFEDLLNEVENIIKIDKISQN
jgi:hypothetical protein